MDNEFQFVRPLIYVRNVSDDSMHELVCPVCGFTYMHIKKVVAGLEEIKITFDGECGHRWLLSFNYYKGCYGALVEFLEKEKQ